MSGFRRCGRLPLKYIVELTHDCAGSIYAETRNVSDTGMFICGSNLSKIAVVGEKIKARIYAEGSRIKEEKEKTELIIVRLTKEGLGLTFA